MPRGCTGRGLDSVERERESDLGCLGEEAVLG